VLGGSHWVLITDYDPNNLNTWYVNDPYFDYDTYDYSGMVWFLTYNVGNPAYPETEHVSKY
jgi:hypothetical protein